MRKLAERSCICCGSQRKCEQAYVAALEQDTSLSEINMAAKQLRESARALTRRLKVRSCCTFLLRARLLRARLLH